ncbi:hypothetical protein DFH27DRAFT_569335 [Peziza echinospora]|nr:hypothetical protein DFH27DRAFT_569335 [Peziza echinospora]
MIPPRDHDLLYPDEHLTDAALDELWEWFSMNRETGDPALVFVKMVNAVRKPYRIHITALNAAASLKAVTEYRPRLRAGTVDLDGWASTTAGSECNTPSEVGTILPGSDQGDQVNVSVTSDQMDEVLAAVMRVEELVREGQERSGAAMSIDQETLSAMLIAHENALFAKIAEDSGQIIQSVLMSHEAEFGRLGGNQKLLSQALGRAVERFIECISDASSAIIAKIEGKAVEESTNHKVQIGEFEKVARILQESEKNARNDTKWIGDKMKDYSETIGLEVRDRSLYIQTSMTTEMSANTKRISNDIQALGVDSKLQETLEDISNRMEVNLKALQTSNFDDARRIQEAIFKKSDGDITKVLAKFSEDTQKLAKEMERHLIMQAIVNKTHKRYDFARNLLMALQAKTIKKTKNMFEGISQRCEGSKIYFNNQNISFAVICLILLWLATSVYGQHLRFFLEILYFIAALIMAMLILFGILVIMLILTKKRVPKC